MSQRPGLALQGYSDPINHALAFAAKYHDQQVRRGNRPPYFAQPANVGIILTRYDCDDLAVIAGILHDMVEDCLAQGYTRQMVEQRVVEKFGADVLAIALAVAQRRVNDEGVELTLEERREDALQRLAAAPEAARWVCSAVKLHTAATLLADLRRTVDPTAVWSRLSGGHAATMRWYRRIVERLRDVGFQAPIVEELDDVVAALETVVPNGGPSPERPEGA
jgi:(p)ppGpp synthase/HD superfamily hydrolase